MAVEAADPLTHPHPNPLPKGEGTRRVADALIVLGLLVLTFALYARVAHFDFINFDDGDYVTQNRVVRHGLTLDGVAWAFTTGHAANWHPLTWLSHMLDVSLFGVDAPGAAGEHHLVNVALHAVNSILLFLFLLRTTQARWAAAFVACAFAVHPLHVESVAWISERKDVLSGLFWMLTMLAYTEYARRKRWEWFAATVVLLALGLMSKPMLVTLPIVLLLLDIWPLRRVRPVRKESQPGAAVPQLDVAQPPPAVIPLVVEKLPLFDVAQPPPAVIPLVVEKLPLFDVAQPPPAVIPLVVEKLPLFLIVAVSSIVTFAVQSQARAVVSTQTFSLGVRVANAIVSYGIYLRQTFAPYALAIFYPHVATLPNRSLSPAIVAGCAAVLIVLTIIAIFSLRRRPWVAVGWFWFLGTLVPVIGLVQVGQQSHADRYMYLPMIGILIIVAYTARDLAQRSPALKPVVVACGFACVAGSFVMSWRQIATWRNSETVMRHAIDVVPDNYAAHDNLGEYLDSVGKHDDARQEYNAAIAIKPDDPIALYNLAVDAQSRGDVLRAARLYKLALEGDPYYAAAWSNYGNLLADQGHTDEAIRAYREAIKLNPDLPEPYHNLALTLAQRGDLDEAIRLWHRALELKPDYTAARDALEKATAYQRAKRQNR